MANSYYCGWTTSAEKTDWWTWLRWCKWQIATRNRCWTAPYLRLGTHASSAENLNYIGGREDVLITLCVQYLSRFLLYLWQLIFLCQTVNRSIDHVPPTMYEYAIEATGPSGERNEQSTLARLINAPPNIWRQLHSNARESESTGAVCWLAYFRP